MPGMSQTTQANFTGLRFAEEVPNCPKMLPGEDGSAQGLTFTIRVTGGSGQSPDPLVVSYTAEAGETIDDVGTALAAAIVALIGAGTAYTANDNTLTIPGAEGIGDATVEFYVDNAGYPLPLFVATITDDGMAADDLDIVLPNLGQFTPSTLDTTNLAVWYELEPNSYGDFGGTVTTVARTPITAGRQRKKGRPTDLDSAAAFQVDFTQDNLYKLARGFFFSNWRTEAVPEFTDRTLEATDTTDLFSAPGVDAAFVEGDIILSTGWANAANNGPFLVSDNGTPDQITVTLLDGDPAVLVTETPALLAKLKRVGYQAAAGELQIDASGGPLPALVSNSGPDFTTWGLVPGQWMFLGGDVTDTAFATPGNNGVVRIAAITQDTITFDKTQNTMADEVAGSLTIQVFFADLIRNEPDPADIHTFTYQFERSLSTAGYQYEPGSVANTLALNIAQADKLNVDLAFVSLDDQPQETRKEGQFPPIVTDNAFFNTSSDFARIRAAVDGEVTPLFAFITEMTLNINNNVTPAKAVGVFGAFDVIVGDFVVEGNITAYFSDIAAVQAVRDSADVTVDFFMVKDNAGWVFDIPLLTLGEGRLNVEKDQAITIPVSIGGAEHPTLHTTLQALHFAYLPSFAG